MKLDISHTFNAIHNNIKLIATEYDEPNYGRTFWKYMFFIDEKLVENEYLNYTYDGLFSDLDNFELESVDGKYVYIPQIANSVVFDTQKNSFFEFKPLETINNNHFIKNIFYQNKLIIVYQRAFQIINLTNYTCQNIIFTFGKLHLINVCYNQNNELLIKYKSLKDYQEYIEKYDLTNLELIK